MVSIRNLGGEVFVAQRRLTDEPGIAAHFELENLHTPAGVEEFQLGLNQLANTMSKLFHNALRWR
jgi:hypothetical protein